MATDHADDRGLTHLDERGAAHMVDVTAKAVTTRSAIARATLVMRPETAALVADRAMAKGDVLAVARIAGIQAAKRTSDLIPLCHPLMLGGVSVDLEVGTDRVEITARVETVDRTGVEMEALTAASVAALTIYDMCKSSDRAMTIERVELVEKTGGRSGTYRRD